MKKIGRNDPCPCGSGKKYKQCCVGKALPVVDAQALCEKGNDFFNKGAYQDALSCYQQAVSHKPELAMAHFGIGVVLQQQGKLEEAEKSYLQAVALKKNLAAAFSNLGIISGQKWELSKAIGYFQKAIAIEPDFADAYHNMSRALLHQWRHEENVRACRKALSMAPDSHLRHSILLMTMNYAPVDRGELFREHLKWDERHGRVGKDAAAPGRDSIDPSHGDRRLRIGYVSPDLGLHPVAYFLRPLLEGHDRSQFEVYCYSERPKTREDEMTLSLKRLADGWRITAGVSDLGVADMIRRDGIDILVDLAGHSKGNRLKVFAMKPAPVQVTWLGYPNTTGLRAIDYRVTDEVADPSGAEEFHSEKLIRLQDGFLCYAPSPQAPEVGALPAAEKGYVTFASFNNLAKVTAEVIRAWSAILTAIPTSRMILKYEGFRDAGCRNRILEAFASHGVTPERLELVAFIDSYREHLALYHRVDVALDTFPYNGTTTTCDALWMGVPVVTLCGDRHSARVGASILSRLALDDLITRSEQEYVERAVKLAADTSCLSVLRSEMRSRMERSPLCDGKTFASEMEQALRSAWKKRCAQTVSATV